MLRNNKKIVAFAAALLLFGAPAAGAHVIGQTVEKSEGQYKIDIGYDSLDVKPLAGESTRFDFNVFKAADGDIVDFDDVEARFFNSDDNLLMFADVKKSGFGLTGLVVTFPKAGKYKVKYAFNKGGEKIVDSSFDLDVDPAYDEEASNPGLRNFINGAILGAGVAFVFSLGYDWVAKKFKK